MSRQYIYTIKELTKKHGTRTVLNNIWLAFYPGAKIGVLGKNGSGKSTLMTLICRFYEVSDGAIMMDGTDIRRHSVADYRQHIGLVLQEPFLFHGTIAENIA